jgi:meiotically up-regulated gene 157 (Mug157) protein
MIYYVTIHITFYETQRFHYSNTFDDSLEVGTSLLVYSLTIDGNVIFLIPKKHHDEIIDQLQDNAAVVEQAELYKENIRQNPPSYLNILKKRQHLDIIM